LLYSSVTALTSLLPVAPAAFTSDKMYVYFVIEILI
jgi:hypothetical protein